MKPRPFGVVDAMLVIAAIAVGLWTNQTEWAWIVQSPQMRFRWRQWPTAPFVMALWGVSMALPHLFACTMAWLVMRVRRPRQSWKRIARRPGTAACLVACTPSIATMGLFAAFLVRSGRTGFDAFVYPYYDRLRFDVLHITPFVPRPTMGMTLVPWSDRVGFAVAGAWLTLWASGRWHPERSWIDRLGRVLGWAWIATAAVVWGLTFL
jgi:hypothetical protein